MKELSTLEENVGVDYKGMGTMKSLAARVHTVDHSAQYFFTSEPTFIGSVGQCTKNTLIHLSQRGLSVYHVGETCVPVYLICVDC